MERREGRGWIEWGMKEKRDRETTGRNNEAEGRKCRERMGDRVCFNNFSHDASHF